MGKKMQNTQPNAIERCADIYVNTYSLCPSDKEGIYYNLSCLIRNKKSICIIMKNSICDVGFVVGNIYFFEALTYAKLDEICVRLDYKRKGYGKKLLEAFEKEASARGAKSIYLEHYVDDGLDGFYSNCCYIEATDKRMRYKIL